jgi:hypothetical protein
MFTQRESLMETQVWISMIRDFAKRVEADVAAEFDDIEARRVNGQIASVLDLEWAENFPLARLEIAARAVAYEVTAVVEQQLHAAAEKPWVKADQYKGPKTALELPPDSLGKLKTATDLRYREVLELVEQYYGISLANLPGWSVLAKLRDYINSFKHRGGWKHPREIDWLHTKLNVKDFRNEITLGQALAAIDALSSFVRALHNATREESYPGLPPGG